MRHFGQTYLIECMFQKATDHSDRDNANRHLSPTSLWRVPRDEKILTDLFQYQEIDPNSIKAHAAPTQPLPAALFEPKNKHASMPMREICSSSTPAWPTFTGQSWQALASDQFLMQYCSAHSCIDDASSAWRSVFAQPGEMLVRGTQRFFVIGTWVSVVMLWQAEKAPLRRNHIATLGAGGGCRNSSGRMVTCALAFPDVAPARRLFCNMASGVLFSCVIMRK